jgi:hypothetical protein
MSYFKPNISCDVDGKNSNIMLQKDVQIEERKQVLDMPLIMEKIVYVREPHVNMIDRAVQYEERPSSKKDA